jgi:RNA polymerase sigma-70 factor, ECF subfamily
MVTIAVDCLRRRLPRTAKERLLQSLSVIAQSSPFADLVVAERLKAFQRGFSRWPDLALSFEQFSSHLDRLGWGASLPGEPEALYLCAACYAGQHMACELLDKTYFPGLKIALLRQSGRHDDIDDILQQARERLLVGPVRRIGTYRGDGPLQSWLLRVVLRLGLDVWRREVNGRRLVALEGLRVVSAMKSEPGVEDIGVEACVGHLERALLEAIGRLSLQDRQLLSLHYVQKLQIDELATCLGVFRSTVYRRLRRVERRVERDCIRSIGARTGISNPDELIELLRRGYRDARVDLRVL